MRRRSGLLIAGLTIAGTLLASTPAFARPIEKGHFHDVFTSDVYDCDGTPAQDQGDVSGSFLGNQRGSSPFPYFRESVHGTIVTTNLETGGTFTQSSPPTAGTTRSWTTVMARSPSPSRPPAVPGSMTRTATSCSRTQVTFGSPSTSTTTALPVTRATTLRSLTRSGSSRIDRAQRHRGPQLL